MSSELTKHACDPSRSVVVRACAGSGKTWLLVSRVIRLLLSGVKPKDILAITFTRKAAEEMRGRLDSLLREFAICDDLTLKQHLLDRGVHQVDLEISMTRARVLFEEVLSQSQGVAISTFHGWFARLLAGAPLGYGVPVGASLREDVRRLQQECMKSWWPTLQSVEKVELKRSYQMLVNELGVFNTNTLLLGSKGFLSAQGEWQQYVLGCLARNSNPTDAIDDISHHLRQMGPFDEALSKADLISNMGKLAELLQSGGKTEREEAEVIAMALGVYQNNQDPEQLRLAWRNVFLTQNLEIRSRLKPSKDLEKALEKSPDGANKLQWIRTIKESYAQLFYDHERWAADMRLQRIYSAWMSLGVDMLAHYRSQKDLMRVQDFSDLESHMAKLIVSSDVAAYLQARLDARYKHLLVDEFQDTNPLQWQILKSWLDAYGQDVDKPSVFIVGDPKQSIYRFRGADARLFDQAADFLKSQFGACIYEQAETRRNSEEVVQAVNRIFSLPNRPLGYPFVDQSRHLHAQGPMHGQAVLLPLIPYPQSAIALADRNPLQDPLPPAGYAAVEQARAEGRRLAELIVEQKNLHQALWGDFLVLVRSRTHLEYIESALRAAGIPCEGAKKGGLLNTLEAADLSALLNVLVMPTDNLQLAHVLKSPLYGLSDDDLMLLVGQAQHQPYQRIWNALAANQNYQAIYQQLVTWQDLATRLPVHDLLDHIFESGAVRHKYACAAPSLKRDQVLSNLDAYLQLALNLDGGRYPSLPKFVRELREISAGDDQETPDEGEFFDAQEDDSLQRVRIMTIHAAKGLEARFVILLNANARPRQVEEGVLVSWNPQDEYPIHLSPRYSQAVADPARDELREVERAIAERENWNLLYVALTRAKQSVFISGRASKSGSGVDDQSWYALAQAAGLSEYSMQWNQSSLKPVKASSPASKFKDYQVVWSSPENFPSEVSKPNFNSQQRRILKLGTAFHAVLEYIFKTGLATPSDLPAAEELAGQLNMSLTIAIEIRGKVVQMLANRKVQELVFDSGIKHSWEELDIVAADGRLMRVDRLLETDDALVILDYKLALSNIDEEIFTEYREQLAGYRHALSQLRDDKPIKAFLVSADGDVHELLD